MWMQPPKILCRQHLLGEHNELHKFVGAINKNGKGAKWAKRLVLGGYIEPSSIRIRHNVLALEMKKRGYNHKSPLPIYSIAMLEQYTEEQLNMMVDRNRSLKDLLARCSACKKRWKDAR